MIRAPGVREQWERVREARADIRASRARAETLLAKVEDLSGVLATSRRELAELTGAVAASRQELAALASVAAASHEELARLAVAVNELAAHGRSDHELTMHALRVVRDDDAQSRQRLWALRESEAYTQAFEGEPLVTIIITTYNNWRLLRERSLPSVLAQTHQRFECIVVGDAAPPEAAEAVASFHDDRLRFVNLPYRGPYPPSPEHAWLISGTTPWNTAMSLARGSWLGAVSDDDALSPTYVESLLAFARAERAEVPYGLITMRHPDGATSTLGAFPPELGQWGMQASLIHAGLRFMPLQPSDWIFGVPNDWSLADRMLRIGVRFAMLSEPVVDYYPSRLWTDRPEPRPAF